jgi:hypothetical protein
VCVGVDKRQYCGGWQLRWGERRALTLLAWGERHLPAEIETIARGAFTVGSLGLRTGTPCAKFAHQQGLISASELMLLCLPSGYPADGAPGTWTRACSLAEDFITTHTQSFYYNLIPIAVTLSMCL